MSSNHRDLRSHLREHPEYTEIEILGEKYGFLLTMYGVEVANKQGEEVIPMLVDFSNRIAGLFADDSNDDIEIGSEEMQKRLRTIIQKDDHRTLSMIVWWGLLTFNPDLDLEEVMMILTPGTLISLVPQIVTKAMNFAEDQTEEDSEFAEALESEGKASDEQVSNESA